MIKKSRRKRQMRVGRKYMLSHQTKEKERGSSCFSQSTHQRKYELTFQKKENSLKNIQNMKGTFPSQHIKENIYQILKKKKTSLKNIKNRKATFASPHIKGYFSFLLKRNKIFRRGKIFSRKSCLHKCLRCLEGAGRNIEL